jgi:hypothetical protein
MNTRFIKTTDNRIQIKLRKHIVLNRIESIENSETGEIEQIEMQTFNPTDEMLFADGWEIYVKPEKPEPTEEEILNREKEYKIEDIIRHDSSQEVNCFYIEGQEMWLDKATRVGLKLRFDAELASGQTNTTLWYEGIPFNLELVNAVQMLNAIELYASACYDNTQSHIANVKSMETIDDIKNYDYRTGYPDKLIF